MAKKDIAPPAAEPMTAQEEQYFDTLVSKPSLAEFVPSSHIVMLADWGEHRAGKVLAADPDLISALDVERAQYRAAKPHEVAIGGFSTF